jgi:hypothetical protein
MPQLSISAEEAALLVSLLRPRTAQLAETLEVQARHCPEGCSDWADTSDALALAMGLQLQLEQMVRDARWAGGQRG